MAANPPSQTPGSAGAASQLGSVEAGYHSPGRVSGRSPDPFSIFNLGPQSVTFIYILLLLNLPSVYWKRALRLWSVPGVNPDDIRAWAMADISLDEATMGKMKKVWGEFAQGHLEEWKVLNVVSVLLCGVLITMLQIDDAAQDPFIRWTILYAVVFALLSLVYGCILVVHFSGTRSTLLLKGWLQWIIATHEEGTNPLWNPYVMLAIPTIWLTWSMIMFCVIIVGFAWRTDPNGDLISRPPLSHRSTLGARIALTIFFGISFYYLMQMLIDISSRIPQDPDENLRMFGETKTPTTASTFYRENGHQ